MSKDKASQETLLCRAPNLQVAAKVRNALIMEFEFVWFFVYNNAEIYVTNDFCGKIDSKVFEKMQKSVKELLRKFDE